MTSAPKKIYVNKNDEAAVIAEKVIDAESQSVVLHVPRFSRLAQSENNFHLLKRESDALKKELTIESVDDAVITLAKAANIPAENPFFSAANRPVADIVTLPKTRPAKRGPALVNAVADAPETPAIDLVKEDAGAEPPKLRTEDVARELDERFGPMPEGEDRPRWGRVLKAGVVAVGITSVLAVVALRVLPRADVSIVREKADWVFKDAMVADKALANVDADAAKVPGQLFVEKRNVTLAFPATGKKAVTVKASGTITISNALSSEPQKLVATTRFVTADGKVFRLVKAVTVPGAKIADGKIVPASIEAPMVADKAGDEYNLSPGQQFSIPGFKGTAKYESFRGETKNPVTGGYVGDLAYPTDEDIVKAKAAITGTLEEGLKAALLAKIPREFKVLDGSTEFRLVKQTVASDVNAAGMFSITANAEMSVMGIREQDVLGALHARIAKDKGAEYASVTEALKYGATRLDAAAGRMSFAVDFTGTIARKVDPDALREKLLSKSERDVKAMVLAVPGLLSARISLWPFWVRSVPGDAAKVTISVE